MKKLLIALMALLLVTGSAVAQTPAKPLSIVALNFPAYDFARQVAGDRAQITMLLPPGTDAHSFEPTPRDVIALQEADLVIYNGGHGEAWVKNLLASLGDNAPASLAMMSVVDTVVEELVEGMEDAPHAHGHDDEDEDGDDHGLSHDARELDEHVWTMPANAIEISRVITKALINLDSAHESQYNENFWAFETKLDDLDVQFRDLVAEAKRRTIVLGDRFPMRYFTREYGLSYYAAFPGCAAETEPSAKTIAFLMDTIKKEEIPVVFYIEFSSQKAARVIAAETGAKPLLLHSAHNVSQEELDAGITYLDIMTQNLNNLKEALN
ncbi:MAG: zinc ABC transporter substrate-binding protein [Clostridiales bacterium]|nr:zinc ABC transporter substrate-binding protein [Clostridiales bacterium]